MPQQQWVCLNTTISNQPRLQPGAINPSYNVRRVVTERKIRSLTWRSRSASWSWQTATHLCRVAPLLVRHLSTIVMYAHGTVGPSVLTCTIDQLTTRRCAGDRSNLAAWRVMSETTTGHASCSWCEGLAKKAPSRIGSHHSPWDCRDTAVKQLMYSVLCKF